MNETKEYNIVVRGRTKYLTNETKNGKPCFKFSLGVPPVEGQTEWKYYDICFFDTEEAEFYRGKIEEGKFYVFQGKPELYAEKYLSLKFAQLLVPAYERQGTTSKMRAEPTPVPATDPTLSEELREQVRALLMTDAGRSVAAKFQTTLDGRTEGRFLEVLTEAEAQHFVTDFEDLATAYGVELPFDREAINKEIKSLVGEVRALGGASEPVFKSALGDRYVPGTWATLKETLEPAQLRTLKSALRNEVARLDAALQNNTGSGDDSI